VKCAFNFVDAQRALRAQCGPKLDANSITLRLQPNEGSRCGLTGKSPATACNFGPCECISATTRVRAYTPEAYERLLLEALEGDATLFISTR